MRTRRLICILILFLTAFSVPAEEILFEKIRENMGRVQTLQADFIQKKRIVSLNYTMTIRGELALDKNGKMAWRVLDPISYVCLISGNTLTQWDEDSGNVLKLDTSKNPALAILARSMSDYFSGNFERMANDFTVSAAGSNQIRLIPHKNSMTARFLKEIILNTSADYSTLTGVRILELGGDETEIEYRNIRKNQPVPESAWRIGKK